MLRHARPKSQPPIKFNEQVAASGRNWRQLIETYDTSTELDIQDLSSNSNSNSSSSSLASNSSSLSTDSSTSTVLNMLNAQQRPKSSIIGRYSSASSASMFSPKASEISEAVAAASSSNDTAEKGRAETSEEDEDQKWSASSSTSSGLSSMNSSSPQVSDELASERKYLDDIHEAVGECLHDLVDSVAEGEQADNEIEYKTFKIHEAILAQTATRSTSGSSDERESPINGPAINSAKSNSAGEQHQLVEATRALMFEAFVVKRLSWNGSDRGQLVRLAREQVSAAIRQMELENLSQPTDTSWLVGLRPDRSELEWCQVKDSMLDCASGRRVEQVKFQQVVDCITDRQLVVWLLKPLPLSLASESLLGQQDVGDELETTLDDIAMALDEPISTSSNLLDGQTDIAELLVWLCSSEADAKWLKSTFRDLSESNNESSLKSGLRSMEGPTNEPSGEQLRVFLSSLPNPQLKHHQHHHHHQQQQHQREHHQWPSYQKSNNHQCKPRSEAAVEQCNASSCDQWPTSKGNKQLANSATKSSKSCNKIEPKQNRDQLLQRQRLKVADVGLARVDNQSIASKEACSGMKVSSAMLASMEEKEPKVDRCRHVVESKAKGGPKEKSVSEMDLSSEGGQQTVSSSVSSSGLASYYRSVASKVISNGQNRIKSFREEMMKQSGQRVAAQNSSRLVGQKSVDGKSGPASLVASQSASFSQQSLGNNSPSLNHQRSIKDKNAASTNGRAKAGEELMKGNDQTPAVKPRTSILKCKQHNGAKEVASENKSSSTTEINPSTAASGQQRRQQSAEMQSALQRTRIRCDEIPTLACKPKSILKSSKSVSNILEKKNDYHDDNDDDDEQESSAKLFQREKQSQNQNCSNTDHHHQGRDSRSQSQQVARDSSLSQRRTMESASEFGSQRSEHYCTLRRGQVFSNSKQQVEKRKSASYSMVNGETKKSVHGNENKEEDISITEQQQLDDRSDRKLAFERLKQRASCYDISRLMSRNGFQGQLEKLRAGSTSSVALGKSRQRRPALLLPGDGNDNEGEIEKIGGHNKLAANEGIETARSVADGTAAAKLRPQTQMRESKRSEFDPRSLRPISTSNLMAANGESKQMKMVVKSKIEKVEKNEKQQQQQVRANESSLFGETNECSSADETICNSSTEDEEGAGSCAEVEMVNSQPGVAAPSSKSRPSPLSKSGPFSLLRQSFNQKTISSMLRLPGRASVRIVSGAKAGQQSADASAPNQPTAVISQKASAAAIAAAEANLLAAKQLKQQAQRLKEQQKRVEQQQQLQQQQQQQQAALDSTSIMLAAVQYNQQLQRQQQNHFMYHHHHHQQQQQQHQYPIGASHMFDATSVHLQHQLLIQRQQHQHHHQQIAYHLNPAHYMAQQMGVALPGGPQMMPLAAQPLVYPMQPAAMVPIPIQAQQAQQQQPQQRTSQSSGIFRRSILKMSSSGSKTAAQANAMQLVYQQQPQAAVMTAPAGQQLMPTMAVNHHSSFNIVYTGSTAAPSNQQVTANSAYEEQPVVQRPRSSLKASMRKTVKSILVSSHKSSSSSSSGSNCQSNAGKSESTRTLKSALKPSSAGGVGAGGRKLVLNSEGSDGDGSSSDSNTIVESPDIRKHTNNFPKSALKKTSTSTSANLNSSKSIQSTPELSSSSDSSSYLASAGNDLSGQLSNYHKRKSLICSGSDKYNIGNTNTISRQVNNKLDSSPLRASNRKSVASVGSRKNVTFSTKLTAI